MIWFPPLKIESVCNSKSNNIYLIPLQFSSAIIPTQEEVWNFDYIGSLVSFKKTVDWVLSINMFGPKLSRPKDQIIFASTSSHP